MPAELMIYALIAAGLVFWLRSILGTKHGEERERPNPFAAPKPGTGDSAESILQNIAAEISATPLALPKNSNCTITNKALEPILLKIAELDRGFTLAHFAQAAQDAFVMIVEAFAHGDRDLLKTLLSPDLYKSFDDALNARNASGETMTAEIHTIRKADITDARIDGKTANITLRFVADETVMTKDSTGTILSGHPDRVSETIDIWTFSRSLTAKDPTWMLVATREEQASPGPIPQSAP